jgi:hypothetical protein
VQKIYATGSEPKEQDGILPLCSRVPPRTWELQYKEQAKLAMLLFCDTAIAKLSTPAVRPELVEGALISV